MPRVASRRGLEHECDGAFTGGPAGNEGSPLHNAVEAAAPPELPPLQAKPLKLVCRSDGTLALAAPAGVVPLEAPARPARARARNAAPPARPRARPGPALAGTAQTGARAVPLWQPQARSAGRPSRAQRFLTERLKAEFKIKIVLLVATGAISLGLATHRPAAPEPTPVVTSLPLPADARYVRIELPAGLLPAVQWLARVGPTALAMVDESWKDASEEEKVDILRTLAAVAGMPEEVLVLNAQSELWAEVYGQAYHIYR